MSVLFETSVGDIVVDLEAELCPKTSENFLKLCKTYYYNFCAFFNVRKDYIAQTGDPTDSGSGGQSFYPSKYFEPEIRAPALKHISRGTLSMAVSNGLCGSQFFFTLADSLDYLDGRHAVFGRVVEGWETLDAINDALLDDAGRPLRDIRLRHVIVLDDPFPDPPGLVIPPNSPTPTPAQLASLRIGDEEELDDGLDPEEVEKKRRERDARAQALTLEMVGDLPFAEVAPPENVLFVCKLNAVTGSEDLELIFSRFGKILSCEVIKDKKTGDSLQYAFIEFEEQKSAEQAYFKMDNVLIDDRRIHVDFSQSVSRLHSDWVLKRTGGRAPPSKSGGGLKRAAAPRGRDDVYEPKGKVSARYGCYADDRSRYAMTFDGDDLRSSGHGRRRTGYDDQDKRGRTERSRSRDRGERHGPRRGSEYDDRRRNRDRSRSPRGRRDGKTRNGDRDSRR